MISKKVSSKTGEETLRKPRTQEDVTRIIALIIAFVSTFIFFIKLVFL